MKGRRQSRYASYYIPPSQPKTFFFPGLRQTQLPLEHQRLPTSSLHPDLSHIFCSNASI
jgi:hypothetical protein